MNPLEDYATNQSRRAFLGRGTLGLGSVAMGSLLNASPRDTPSAIRHFAPSAKRVIYLFQSGGPAQMDLFDYKPGLAKRFGEEVPTSVYPAERKTTMTSGQTSFPVAPSTFEFHRRGQSGIWLSESLPYLSAVIDDLCVIKSMHTEAINHDPAATLFQTGSPIAGRPSMGAWVNYGLGTDNANLPAFVALTSNGTAKTGQPLYDRLWGPGFLPAASKASNSAARATRSSTSTTPPASPAPSAAACSTRCRNSTATRPATSTTRTSPHASPSTNSPTACR